MANILNFPLGDITPTAGNLLIGSGSAWVTNALSGNITVNSSGVTTIGSAQVTNSMLAGGIDLTAKVSNTLPFNNGGLGFNTATLGDLFYASATNTPGKLSDVALGSVLISGGVGAAPTWSSSPTLTGLNLSGLTASEAVVTDGSNNLTSLAYTSANTASTLVERDSSGNFSANVISADLAGTATNADSANYLLTSTTTANTSFYIPLVQFDSTAGQLYYTDGNGGLSYNPSTATFDVNNGTSGNIVVGVSTSTGLGGSLRMNASPIYFNTGTDKNHGLGIYTNSNKFNSINVNGPVLFGNGGGLLGRVNGSTQTPVLSWTSSSNIGLCLSSTSVGSFGGGVGVMFLQNATTTPTSNPSNGGILFETSGSFHHLGSSGTNTTVGVADPHCPDCGGDFGWEWENEKYGGNLRICAICFAKEFKGRSYIRWNENKKAA